MAIVKVPHLGRTLIMPAEMETLLAGIGVEYRRWTRVHPIPAKSSTEEILKAYAPELESCKRKNDFAGYNFLELAPDASRFGELLNEFKAEHWHKDFESIFLLAGRGICYIHPRDWPVVSVELEPGDLISIGKGIRHWCDFSTEVFFRAIRFLSKPENDTTVYTRSGIEAEYEAVYVSPAYFSSQTFH